MSSCSKTPDIMAWYEKEGALDINHVQGCPDCQKEKESLADFYAATRELKNGVPAIPKNIERRLERLSASSIILEATRRSLNFWAAVAKVESILLLLMGLALITLLGKTWQPVHQNPVSNMKEISTPAEILQKSDVSDSNQNKTEIISTPAPKPEAEKNTPAEKAVETEASSPQTENSSGDLPEKTILSQETQEQQNASIEEISQTTPAESSSSSAEISAQDQASLKSDLKNSSGESYEIEALPAGEEIPEESAAPVSSEEIHVATQVSVEEPNMQEETQTASAALEMEDSGMTQEENETSGEIEILSENNETHVQEYKTENDEQTSTDYSKVLESASDVLTTSVYQEKVNTPVLSHSEHYLTAGQNARSRSRPSMGSEWSPGMAKMLPVFLGNGYILDKTASFHPMFKPALDQMNENRPEEGSIPKPGHATEQKKPALSNLSFKDALKNNQNLEIPAFEEDAGDSGELDASDVQAIHPEDKDNASEWKTNSQKDIKGKKFDHHPGVSQEAIEKLGGNKDKPHQKFNPPKEKGPKPPGGKGPPPPGGKVPKFKAPIGKAFNPPGSKTPIPPGGKGPPPPGGL